MTNPSRKSSLQSGFTLLELLLVIGVTAVLFLGVMQITRGWVNNEVSSGAGQHMQRVTAVVQSYIENNWDQLTETADAVNGGAAGWGNLKAKLDEEGLLSAGNLRNPLGTPLQISYTKVGGISRATIFATLPMSYERVIEAAKQTGTSGGLVSVFPDALNAYGAYGQWRLPLAQLYPPSAGTFPCVPTNTGSCFVSMISYNDSTLCGLYLYRTTVTDCPDGSTMATNLNMNKKNITNARNVTAETMTVNTDARMSSMSVLGTTTLNGQTVIDGGGLTSNGGMVVNNDATFGGSVDMTGGGNLKVLTLDVNTVTAERIEATNVKAQDVSVNGRVAVDNTVTLNGDLNVNGAASEIFAASINAGQIDAGNGAVQVGSMEIQNTMQINAPVTITGGAIATDQLVISKCATIKNQDGTSKTYGSC